VDFFQYLTQAATKVDRCAVVASLLATDPAKSDAFGKELTQELYGVFRRQREEGVLPVQKEDVAEILRRRFFTPESIRDREAFRPHVVAALKGVSALDEQTAKEAKSAEERYLRSFPFHPDLTEVLYAKWTGMESFQRTRGILRTFALALRDADRWDRSPLVSTNVFLSKPGEDAISESAREFTSVATSEEYEGKRQEWGNILQSELGKARQIQQMLPGLRHRELEGAAFATFLHSQPIGHKALTRELCSLVGHTRPDKIELGKGLKGWADVSWFLDETALAETEMGEGESKGLPKAWRLGSKPNLKQMHSAACENISAEVVEARLLDEIQRVNSLTAGASAVVGKVHKLPDRPRDIEDDGEFHYAVLGPKAASDSGKPNPDARCFIDQKTTPDTQRVFRNAVLLVVPSRDGLEIARNAVKDYLGWEEVASQLGLRGKPQAGADEKREQEVDPVRSAVLAANREAARKKMPDTIRQAYCIVVTVSRENEVQAFKLAINDKPLFQAVKDDPRSRIQDTAITAEAMLPGGPYDLWREGETAHRLKDLVNAFAQRPHLPKMLNRKAILDTLIDGCASGTFVLRLTRPDKSIKTFWRQAPDEVALKDATLEVVLAEAALLTEIPAALLAPGVLPGLWKGQVVSVGEVLEYFSGGKVVQVQKDGYQEALVIPKAERTVVEAAIEAAIKEGRLWLTCGPASVFREDVPTGLLTADAQLQPPPEPISPMSLVPELLPDAWSGGCASGLSMSVALSKKAGKALPWATVREAIEGALRTRILERTEDSGAWPCDYPGAKTLRLRIPEVAPLPPPAPPPPPKPGVLAARAELRPSQIQDLADQVSEITRLTAGMEVKFSVEIELSGTRAGSGETIAKVNEILGAISEGFGLK